MSESRFGNRGQYQPVVILIFLLVISLSITYFSLRKNREMGAEKRSYRAFYTKRVFHTVMKKKVKYNGKNHTLLQLAGEALCPRDTSEDCNLSYYGEFREKVNSSFNKVLPDKYKYYLKGNSDTNCSLRVPEVNRTYLERASVIQFRGLGYNECNFTLRFATWIKK